MSTSTFGLTVARFSVLYGELAAFSSGGGRTLGSRSVRWVERGGIGRGVCAFASGTSTGEYSIKCAWLTRGGNSCSRINCCLFVTSENGARLELAWESAGEPRATPAALAQSTEAAFDFATVTETFGNYEGVRPWPTRPSQGPKPDARSRRGAQADAAIVGEKKKQEDSRPMQRIAAYR